MICGEEAKYMIKGNSDYYCEECAEENFDDLSALEKIDEDTTKKLIQDKLPEEESDDEEQMDSKIIFIGLGIIALIYLLLRSISYLNKVEKDVEDEISEIISSDKYKVKGQYE